MNIVSNRKIYFSISALLITISLLALFFWGLKFGIDFTGGSLMEIEFLIERPTSQDVQDKLADLDLGKINIQPSEDKAMILRFKDIDEPTHQKILASLEQSQIEEKRFESIGPIIGQELKRKAGLAIGFVLIAIVLYIAWAFRKVSKPVASWRYGLVSIVALFHDIFIVAGLFAILGHFYQIEIGLPFVAALLTILGYSVNNTIVIFDRTRENLLKSAWDNFEQILNQSILQSATRCINTALTTLLVLASVYFFGGHTIKYFVLALMVGIVIGTYSSMFIANPLIAVWSKRLR